MIAKEGEIKRRKEKLEARLKEYGIDKYQVTHLGYVDDPEEDFATPIETGKRMLILYAVSYVALYGTEEPKAAAKLTQWLKDTQLWDDVSLSERDFLEDTADDTDIDSFAWKLEAAYVLAWTLGLVPERPSPTSDVSQEQLNHFMDAVPQLLTDPTTFLNNLSYIDKSEILLKNLFNELGTTYFRDLYFSGEQNTTALHSYAVLERHRALNWLRRFCGITDWDDTDTST